MRIEFTSRFLMSFTSLFSLKTLCCLLAYTVVVISLITPLAAQTNKGAMKFCVRSSDSKLFIRSRCKRDETRIQNLSELIGAQGPTGETGQSGQNGNIAVYGDGSAGSLVVAASSILDWTETPPSSSNLQFSDCTIPSGSMLVVPSGLIIKCRDSINVSGGIQVKVVNNNGYVQKNPEVVTTLFSSVRYPSTVLGLATPAPGEVATASALASELTLNGGAGGTAISQDATTEASARFIAGIFRGAALFGGGGAAALHLTGPTRSFSSGGRGGGSLVLLSQGEILINGSLGVNGEAPNPSINGGGGGGAGGLLVLASNQAIEFGGTAVINADGAQGSLANTTCGAGGGGGGGIVQLIAPNLPSETDVATVVSVSGGQGGLGNSVSHTGNYRQAGPGGGGFGGSGGKGADITSLDTVALAAITAENGSDGHISMLTASPTNLFLGY